MLGHFPRSAASHECTECILFSCQFFEDEVYSNCVPTFRGQNVGITHVIAVLSLKCQDRRCFFPSRCTGITAAKVYLFMFLL